MNVTITYDATKRAETATRLAMVVCDLSFVMSFQNDCASLGTMISVQAFFFKFSICSYSDVIRDSLTIIHYTLGRHSVSPASRSRTPRLTYIEQTMANPASSLFCCTACDSQKLSPYIMAEETNVRWWSQREHRSYHTYFVSLLTEASRSKCCYLSSFNFTELAIHAPAVQFWL